MGVDASADGDRALDWAAAWAAAHGMTVHVLVGNPSVSSELPFWTAEDASVSDLTDDFVADACRRVLAHGADVT